MEDHPQLSPNKGMDRTTEALTTKEKVKMENHKERERQMEVAPGKLCQCNISCLHFFFFFKVLFSRFCCQNFLKCQARVPGQAGKPASLGCKCQKITNTASYSSSSDMRFHFCQIDAAIEVVFQASWPRWHAQRSQEP